MFCPYCGRASQDGTRFCPYCGRVLPVLPPSNLQPPVYNPPPTYNPPPVYNAPPVYNLQPPQPQPPKQRPPAYGLGIAAMVTGILSVLCCVPFISSLVAIIFGAYARVKGNRGAMALTGLICGIVGLTLSFVVLISGGFDGFIEGFWEGFYEGYHYASGF